MDMIKTQDPNDYTTEKGIFIAEAFADGAALRDICEHSNGWLPAMLYVKRWRSMFPAFDSLMVEAAACRAENMVEDFLEISDDATQQAAHNRNRMTAREKAAGWMAPRDYGQGSKSDTPSDVDSAPVYVLTDEQLLAIAAGKLATPAIEGEFQRLESEGVRPPNSEAPTAQYEISGTQQSRSNSGEYSVTTTEFASDEDLEDILLPPIGSEKKIEEPGDTERERLSFIGMG